MALIGNKLYRNVQSKQDEVVDIDQQLSRLEDDIRKLKIDFDIYFNGGTKRPPLEARARLDSYIKRIADNRNLSYAQRYYFNTLVARFTSYRELWRRTQARRPHAQSPVYEAGRDRWCGQTAKIVSNTFFPNCQTP